MESLAMGKLTSALVGLAFLSSTAQAQQTGTVQENMIGCKRAADVQRIQEVMRARDREAAALFARQRVDSGDCRPFRRRSNNRYVFR
jgi:hypothetical protein